MNILARKLILNLLLFATIFILSLKIGDIALGMFLGINSQATALRHLILREPAPNYSRILKPDKETLNNSEGMDAKSVLFRVDQDGFIMGPVNSKGDVDIVFVGGSTTECAHVDEEVRFPALVSRLLKRKTGDYIRTLNAGYSGNNLMHNLLVILAKVLPYKPRCVVIMENVNDLSLLNKSGSYWMAPRSRSLVQYSDKKDMSIFSSCAMTAKDLLFPNSWQILKPYFGQLFMPTLVDEFADYRANKIDDVSFEQAMWQFHSALKTIVSTVKAWGSEPILMVQFNRLQVGDTFVMMHSGMSKNDYENFVNKYKEFNNIIREVAKEEKVYLIDLDNEIPHSSEYIVDSVHLNDKGSKLVAHVIAKHIVNKFPDYAAAFQNDQAQH